MLEQQLEDIKQEDYVKKKDNINNNNYIVITIYFTSFRNNYKMYCKFWKNVW